MFFQFLQNFGIVFKSIKKVLVQRKPDDKTFICLQRTGYEDYRIICPYKVLLYMYMLQGAAGKYLSGDSRHTGYKIVTFETNKRKGRRKILVKLQLEKKLF